MSAQEQQVIKAPGYAARLRVRVADPLGTLRDLTSLDLAGGRDFTRSIRVERHIDQDFATCSFSLRRRLDRHNISPLVSLARANLVTGSYSPLLARGRLCVAEAYLLPAEVQPTSGDWREVFRGEVGTIDEAQDTIEVQALDQWHALSDASHFLEVERSYASGGGVAVQTIMQQLISDSYGRRFVASGAYTNRDRVIPTTANGFWYRSESTASAGTEPSWTTTVGNTSTSGSVTFRCMGTIPQLYTPVSPAWNIAPAYNQKRVACWQAIRSLVNQFGWALGDRYDSGAGAWKLTLYLPDRTNTTPDFSWYPDVIDASGVRQPSLLALPTWRTGAEDVRNVIDLTYSDPADLDVAGKPKRKTVSSRDVTSIDANLWRWMGVAEGAASQVTNATEAARMTDAIRDDLKDPLATHEARLPLFWPVELNDLAEFKANGITYDSDQKLAVVGIAHEQGESGAATTTLTCRGKPSAGFERWRALGYDASALRPATYNGPNQPTGVTLTKAQGGLVVTWAKPTSGPPVLEYEVHVSTSSGFTPDATTLKATTDATSKTIPDLVPGTTYYVQVVPRGLLGERGAASTEVSTDAGYTKPRDMVPNATYERIVPNPDFEIFTQGSGAPPDSWYMRNGSVWGTVAQDDTSATQSGGHAIHFPDVSSGTAADLYSDPFPVVPGDRYELTVWAKRPVSNGGGSFNLVWLSDLTGSSGFGTTTGSAPGGTIVNSTSYALNFAAGVAPAGAKYARVELTGGTHQECWFDNVAVRRVATQWSGFSYGSGWGDGAVSWPGASMRNSVGVVFLRGSSKRSSGSGTTIATLPVGQRPGADEYFILPNLSGGVDAYVIVKTTGVIQSSGLVNNGDNFSLSGICFMAEG